VTLVAHAPQDAKDVPPALVAAAQRTIDRQHSSSVSDQGECDEGDLYLVLLPAAEGVLPLRFVRQVLALRSHLTAPPAAVPAPSAVLIQCPPAAPSLLALYLFAPSIPVIVDWHNYGFTLLALRLLAPSLSAPLRLLGSLVLYLATFIELALGATASYHLTVSRALGDDLVARRVAPAPPAPPPTLLPDQPSALFAPIRDRQVTHTLFQEFAHLLGPVRLESDVIIVSATSWGPDEDFGLLVTALDAWEARQRARSAGTFLRIYLTGRGAMRDHYMGLFAQRAYRHCAVTSVWLPLRAYATLLASAHLSLSLHASSSGLDLPMKVVDSFGAGVPVAAVSFATLRELVVDGVNGRTFADADGLVSILTELFDDWPTRNRQYRTLRAGAEDSLSEGWEAQWTRVVAPIVRAATCASSSRHGQGAPARGYGTDSGRSAAE